MQSGIGFYNTSVYNVGDNYRKSITDYTPESNDLKTPLLSVCLFFALNSCCDRHHCPFALKWHSWSSEANRMLFRVCACFIRYQLLDIILKCYFNGIYRW